MARDFHSLYRSDNSDANQVEWLDYSVEARPAGQWDELSAVLEGHWSSPKAAYDALIAKRLHLPGASTTSDYAFYVADGTLRTAWAKGGRVRAEISAPGLIAQKWKLVEYNTSAQYSLSNVTVGSGVPGLASGLYGRLQVRNWQPAFDVQVAWRQQGTTAIDLSTAGRRVTSHWAALLAGKSLSTGPSNPFSGSDVTYHYPCDWYYDVQPGDTLGGGKLALATFKFAHQLDYTL